MTALRTVLDPLLGPWHVAHKAIMDAMFPAVDGVAEANKPVTTDASGNVTITGTLTSAGSSPSGAVLGASSIKSSSATAGIGYATGAGGAVTQATNKSTAVTLSKICGAITLNNAALAAAAEATFTVTNTAVAATDVVLACHGSAGTSGAYNVNVSNITAGTFDITVSNLSAGSLSEAIVINFAVIKAVAA